MIGYYNEGSRMAGDWLKVIILYHFYEDNSKFWKKDGEFGSTLRDYQQDLQEGS